jgi:hypothetical protein
MSEEQNNIVPIGSNTEVAQIITEVQRSAVETTARNFVADLREAASRLLPQPLCSFDKVAGKRVPTYVICLSSLSSLSYSHRCFKQSDGILYYTLPHPDGVQRIYLCDIHCRTLRNTANRQARNLTETREARMRRRHKNNRNAVGLAIRCRQVNNELSSQPPIQVDSSFQIAQQSAPNRRQTRRDQRLEREIRYQARTVVRSPQVEGSILYYFIFFLCILIFLDLELRVSLS